VDELRSKDLMETGKRTAGLTNALKKIFRVGTPPSRFTLAVEGVLAGSWTALAIASRPSDLSLVCGFLAGVSWSNWARMLLLRMEQPAKAVEGEDGWSRDSNNRLE
jgi:hypothetical protein